VYRRKTLLLLVVLAATVAIGLFGAATVSAAPSTTTTTLTPSQEALALHIEGGLIAPCCWVQTVAVHDSQIAKDIKREVREAAAQGQTEDQILGTFVDRYGEKILAAPRAEGFNLLAYLVPFATAMVAAGIIVMLVVRWRRPALAALEGSGAEGPATPDTPAALRDRLDDELKRFDD
jgi:cytochrome c-type biogenesis protein CcmH